MHYLTHGSNSAFHTLLAKGTLITSSYPDELQLFFSKENRQFSLSSIIADQNVFIIDRWESSFLPRNLLLEMPCKLLGWL